MILKLLLSTLALLFVLGMFYGISFSRSASISRELVATATPFQQTSMGNPSVLVIGDSTGVGVGASEPEESVAGRLAAHVRAGRVENYSVSGAMVADLPKQIARASQDQYDYILVQVGGNDIIHFRSAAKASAELREVLKALPSSGETIVLSAGNVGAATLFPWFMRPFYTHRTRAYHEAFGRVVSELGGTYVPLYEEPRHDPFVQEPNVYLSADGLHPSSEGYRLWFEKVIARGAL